MEEVNIELILNENGDIIVRNDDEDVLQKRVIDSTMQVSGEEIYNSIKYDINKKYILSDLTELPENASAQLKHRYEAIKKLYNFYYELITSINQIDHNHRELTEEISLNE